MYVFWFCLYFILSLSFRMILLHVPVLNSVTTKKISNERMNLFICSKAKSYTSGTEEYIATWS